MKNSQLDVNDIFGKFNRCKNHRTKTTSFEDLLFHLYPTLLKHVSTIATQHESAVEKRTDSSQESTEEFRLLYLEKSNKLRCSSFFNSDAGVAFHLNVHSDLQQHICFNKRFVLCGGNMVVAEANKCVLPVACTCKSEAAKKRKSCLVKWQRTMRIDATAPNNSDPWPQKLQKLLRR